MTNKERQGLLYLFVALCLAWKTWGWEMEIVVIPGRWGQ